MAIAGKGACHGDPCSRSRTYVGILSIRPLLQPFPDVPLYYVVRFMLNFDRAASNQCSTCTRHIFTHGAFHSAGAVFFPGVQVRLRNPVRHASLRLMQSAVGCSTTEASVIAKGQN